MMDTEKRNEEREVIHFDQLSEASICSEPPLKFRRHWHMSTEFVYCRSNHVVWEVNGAEYALKTGDILLVWPTELHAIVHEPKDGVSILQFPSTILDGCPDLSLSLMYLRRRHLLKKEENPQLNERLFELFNQIEKTSKTEFPFRGLQIRVYIYQVLLEIGHMLWDGAEITETDTSSQLSPHSINLKMDEACAYISQNYNLNLTLEEMAQRCGYSPYYFSRLFHEYTSQTFKEYMFSKRIQHAISMLIDGDDPITEIAYQVGFQSISRFNKVFKNHMSCTPNEYRKMYDDKAKMSSIISVETRAKGKKK